MSLEQTKINALADIYPQETEGNAVVMVGTFAPVHEGHLDAIRAASSALTDRGLVVGSAVLTPNSSEYVQRKLPDDHQTWTFERRVRAILDHEPHPSIPTYVDTISGPAAGTEQINRFVPQTVQQYLGHAASEIYLVVGSDQLPSMEAHLEHGNRAVCVLRPGNMEEVERQRKLPWVEAAVEEGRFIITGRPNMENDISSTAIRRSVAAESYHDVTVV